MWQQSQDPNAGLPVQGACFFQETRVKGPGRTSLGNSATNSPFLGGNCVFPAPLRPFSLGKSVCLVSLGPFTPLV